MGFPVFESHAEEAPTEDAELSEPDWYQLYCQAIAAGADPKKFGDYTYSEIMALIDAHKLRRFNDMYFNVSNIVGQMSDEGVRDAINGNNSSNPQRGKLVEKMLRPYSPSFMLSEVMNVRASRPIEGLSPKTAEGIMQAIEQRLVPHGQWLAIHPIWQRILATARLYKQ